MIEAMGGVALVCLSLLVIVLASLSGIQKRLATLSRVEGKLDSLLQHAGIQYDPYVSAPPQVAEAICRGEKISAIKYYREATGAGLKEAKEFVEEVQ